MEVAWHVGDNNGMPQDANSPLSDLAQSLAQTDDPPQPSPTPTLTPSGPIGSDSSNNSSSSDSSSTDSIGSSIQTATWRAAHMESVGEAEQAKQEATRQQAMPLQTIALDEHELPSSASSATSQQVRRLFTYIIHDRCTPAAPDLTLARAF